MSTSTTTVRDVSGYTITTTTTPANATEQQHRGLATAVAQQRLASSPPPRPAYLDAITAAHTFRYFPQRYIVELLYLFDDDSLVPPGAFHVRPCRAVVVPTKLAEHILTTPILNHLLINWSQGFTQETTPQEKFNALIKISCDSIFSKTAPLSSEQVHSILTLLKYVFAGKKPSLKAAPPILQAFGEDFSKAFRIINDGHINAKNDKHLKRAIDVLSMMSAFFIQDGPITSVRLTQQSLIQLLQLHYLVLSPDVQAIHQTRRIDTALACIADNLFNPAELFRLDFSTGELEPALVTSLIQLTTRLTVLRAQVRDPHFPMCYKNNLVTTIALLLAKLLEAPALPVTLNKKNLFIELLALASCLVLPTPTSSSSGQQGVASQPLSAEQFATLSAVSYFLKQVASELLPTATEEQKFRDIQFLLLLLKSITGSGEDLSRENAITYQVLHCLLKDWVLSLRSRLPLQRFQMIITLQTFQIAWRHTPKECTDLLSHFVAQERNHPENYLALFNHFTAFVTQAIKYNTDLINTLVPRLIYSLFPVQKPLSTNRKNRIQAIQRLSNLAHTLFRHIYQASSLMEPNTVSRFVQDYFPRFFNDSVQQLTAYSLTSTFAQQAIQILRQLSDSLHRVLVPHITGPDPALLFNSSLRVFLTSPKVLALTLEAHLAPKDTAKQAEHAAHKAKFESELKSHSFSSAKLRKLLSQKVTIQQYEEELTKHAKALADKLEKELEEAASASSGNGASTAPVDLTAPDRPISKKKKTAHKTK